MNSRSDDRSSAPARGILPGLASGRLRWDALDPFPERTPEERAADEKTVADIAAFYERHVDPEELDRTRTLPEDFLDDLQRRGYLRLGVGPELGGLDLSSYAVFEAVARAAQWSVPAAQIMAIQAGVGAPAMLPALPEGPLATHVRRRITEGTVSGFGDTDHAGQNNSRPVLTATPTPDGTAYELTGDKLFIGNGTVADLLPVSAVLDDPDRSRVGVCFVDTRTPGFEVASAIEFMGSRGLPNGALRLHKVRVPREHVLVEGDGDRLPAAIGFLGLVGRLHFTGAPALAIARNCAEWSRDFVVRRTVDGRPLGDYEQIQRLVATTVAEVYAMESVARLGLIGAGLSDRWLEQFLAKNVLVRTAGRIADRTVSLLGAEGFETVASKRRRGAPDLPVERAYRDARGLRIAGNVDFQLDNQAAQLLLAAFHRDPALGRAEPSTDPGPSTDAGAHLTEANRAHLTALAEHTADLARTCRELADGHDDLTDLYAQEGTLALVAQTAAEVLSVSAALARASHLTSTGEDGDAQALADVYCTGARHRIESARRRLAVVRSGAEPDYAAISRAWLSVSGRDREASQR
ncbi:acyl-CoA dehydrogenase family protein [Streptomyces sp. STR69]|uniref:acyl-CoA dehydrogenase family protein n=1 Tax=Streptomyces sp. STR69 TaxID=1796942 RepID=UPI0021C62DB9|nr:acyl-CoA dehydrogenase family protein [Streptomyces sp. STR69]